MIKRKENIELEILKKHYWKEPHTKDTYGGIYILRFKSKPFKFNWFTDYGEWFVYIHLGEKWWRFSGAGYMSSEIRGRKRR